jgi:hypothetical protein
MAPPAARTGAQSGLETTGRKPPPPVPAKFPDMPWKKK